MIKECPVIINNGAVTVAKYGEVEIQFPPIHSNDKTIFVEFEDGKYHIVGKSGKDIKKDINEYDSNTKKKVRKKKKAPVIENKENDVEEKNAEDDA